MLSETYSIEDIKKKLENDYLFFKYSSDALFKAALENVGDDVMRIYFYPRIGQTQYEITQAKDKVDLDDCEVNLYWAEIFTVCYEFLSHKTSVLGSLQSSSSESLKVEGYSYQTREGGSSSNPGDDAMKGYRAKMFKYWMLAGYNIDALERTCNIFGNADPDGRDIIL